MINNDFHHEDNIVLRWTSLDMASILIMQI